jgi:glycosyltransferase involved in cell wall biosynthesis
MNILIYTPVFYPMIGGMESVSQTLAELFVKAGHECKLVTPVINSKEDKFSFPVFRNPGLLTKIKLILWADIVYSNGATLALLFLAKLCLKPFVWTHAGYQASCIDGLGWAFGKPAPMTPLESIGFYWRKKGLLFTMKEALKLLIRRIAATYIVNMNIAITDWMAMRQPFKRQVRIYNSVSLSSFAVPSKVIKEDFDFVYLGRLVSEKGVAVLLEAFALVVKQVNNVKLKLLIIGDGDQRSNLEERARKLGIADKVTFAGSKSGQELTDLVHSAKIAVVPSEWEEPMGVVALELMAAGRNIIVSERGGLKECVGNAGLTFSNGNSEELSKSMIRLLEDYTLAEQLKQKAREQLKSFNPEILINEYIYLFKKILKQ